ncbi:MAG: hypothetical protein Q8P57_00535 [Candidatus Pacearchaeota archaeon]|nr:hypothetical protein [Candidatus Pacearchaeota archaeon]
MEFAKTMDLRDEKYVEAIRDGEIVRVPKSVAKEEDLFILREVVAAEKPSDSGNYNARDFYKKDKISDLRSSSRLQEWKNARFNVKKNNVTKDLIDNFHWVIARNRRKKGISRDQLAFKIGVSEEEIKMIEMGELPRDDFVLVNRIESFFGINLRKEKPIEGKITIADLQRMDESKVRKEIERTHKRQMSGEVRAGKEEVNALRGDDIELIDLD